MSQAIDTKVNQLESTMSSLTTESTLEWPAARIRQTFVDFFVQHSKLPHVMYPSCPVVPLDDPTLLFINAGMNQYKPIFLGQVDPSHPMAKLTRATNSQKCIRAGGKHNDLDDVGKDVYHHTFFEMLGNWSFGDYFKAEAVDMSYTLLVEVYKLDPSRLYATYFGGDEAQGLPSDEETRQLWLKYLPAERVLPFGCADNFWEMGDVGPCGPCTEIHYDRIGNRDAADLVNADSPDVIEIWNNVFIQFNREIDGKLVTLPSQHVDTGMGFERLASILQGKDSNYDTDVFTPLFSAIERFTGAPPYTGKLGQEDPTKKDMAYRVVADHIRTLTFAITDGAVPSNDGRGYVLRRILRRAVRYAQQFLGAKNEDTLLSKLVPTVVKMLGEAFPELYDKESEVIAIVVDEELSFGKTLQKGLDRFRKLAISLQQQHLNVVSGEDAFFLYDSMGFPLDLTQIMAEEVNMTVDIKAYEACMQRQSDRSKMDRKKGSAAGSVARPLVLEANETSWLKQQNIQPTDDLLKYEWPTKANSMDNIKATILAMFVTTETYSGFVQSLAEAKMSHGKDSIDRIGLILDQTTFYAQAGGQIYDTGLLHCGSNSFPVDSVEVYAGFVLHMGSSLPLGEQDVKVGDTVILSVDYNRRALIAPNHTMTHVLNFALRQVLGLKVDQRGSLVDEVKLRFDFTQNKALTTPQLEAVENICNDVIKQSLPVFTRNTEQSLAKRIQGLRAVFGETYPEKVRVVSIGQPIEPMLNDPENVAWAKYSVEFCGGTHLSNTEEAKTFVLYEEGAIAKGIRRVSAYTGELAVEAQTRALTLEKDLHNLSAIPTEDSGFSAQVAAMKPVVDSALISLPAKDKLRKMLNECVDRLKVLKKAQTAEMLVKGLANAKSLGVQAKENSQQYIVEFMEGMACSDPKIGGQMLDVIEAECSDASIMLFCVDEDAGKTVAFTRVSQSHLLREPPLDARTWVNAAMAPLNGKGGGRDGKNATGQAKCVDLGNVSEAVKCAKAFVG